MDTANTFVVYKNLQVKQGSKRPQAVNLWISDGFCERRVASELVAEDFLEQRRVVQIPRAVATITRKNQRARLSYCRTRASWRLSAPACERRRQSRTCGIEPPLRSDSQQACKDSGSLTVIERHLLDSKEESADTRLMCGNAMEKAAMRTPE